MTDKLMSNDDDDDFQPFPNFTCLNCPPKKKKLGRPRKANAEYAPTESQICVSFIDYIAKAHPNLKDFVIKIDNEGKTSWALGKRKKKEGKIAGASDYFIAIPIIRPGIMAYGLWLEIKTQKGKESAKQKEFGQRVLAQGYAYGVAHGIDMAIKTFEDYINAGKS